jgi:hypothetical protein
MAVLLCPLANRALPVATAHDAPHLGPALNLSAPVAPDANHQADVAHNAARSEYLVVWHSAGSGGRGEVWARRVAASGQPLAWFSVSTGETSRFRPAVACNPDDDEYLIVWMWDVHGDRSRYEIWGHIVSGDGAARGAEFPIAPWPEHSFWSPRVVWNPEHQQFLVLWNAWASGEGKWDNAGYAILDKDGAVLSASRVSSDGQPHDADVAYCAGAGRYLVVWTAGDTPLQGDIRAALVDGASGAVLTDPGLVTVSAAEEDQLAPSVTANQGDRFLVVWQHAAPGTCFRWQVRGQALDSTGALAGSQLLLADSAHDETLPTVAARPGVGLDYVLVWQRNLPAGQASVWARRGSGATALVAEASGWLYQYPTVSWGGSHGLLVYEGQPGEGSEVNRHIHARRWVPDVVWLPIVLR